jgi:hypothetical protein
MDGSLMSAITVVGERSHIADYLADSVLFGESETRQHWGSDDGNYVVDGRNFLVFDARVDYEPTAFSSPPPAYVESPSTQPVPEPATWFLAGIALVVAVIRRRFV